MSNIWLISDTHLGHNKTFIWKARGFDSVWDMNNAIIERWNEVVKYDDIVYHLGDVMMGDLDAGIKLVKQLNGKIRLAIGNHDSSNRIDAFRNLSNFDDIQFGYRLKDGKKTLLLTHYPLLSGNFDNSKTYSIHGHTHSPNPFCEYDMMYNVNCDAHDCRPVAYEDMIAAIMQRKNNIFKDKID